MGDPIIRLTYEGGDADANAIDMRLLGLSLQGADRITSDGLILLVQRRAPKRGERAPLIVKVREPLAGSYDLPGMLQDAVWLLPLGQAISEHVVSGFVGYWWEAVKAKFLGREEASNRAVEAMLEMNRDHLAARDASETRTHEERMASHALQMAYAQIVRETLAQQHAPLEQFAAPVGRSVESAKLTPGTAPPISVDTPEAEVIRDAGDLVWTELREEPFRTDGFKFHTSGLSIENPDRPGFLMARVTDPRFEKEENVYTEAAQRRSVVVVLARRGYKGGKLVALDIVDFRREITP